MNKFECTELLKVSAAEVKRPLGLDKADGESLCGAEGGVAAIERRFEERLGFRRPKERSHQGGC
jgi:hypothetical protein